MARQPLNERLVHGWMESTRRRSASGHTNAPPLECSDSASPVPMVDSCFSGGSSPALLTLWCFNPNENSSGIRLCSFFFLSIGRYVEEKAWLSKYMHGGDIIETEVLANYSIKSFFFPASIYMESISNFANPYTCLCLERHAEYKHEFCDCVRYLFLFF